MLCEGLAADRTSRVLQGFVSEAQISCQGHTSQGAALPASNEEDEEDEEDGQSRPRRKAKKGENAVARIEKEIQAVSTEGADVEIEMEHIKARLI